MDGRKRSRRLLYISIILVLLCTLGCSTKKKNTDRTEKNGTYRIYCTDKAMTELKWEYYTPVSAEVPELAYELMQRISTVPSNELYRKAVTDNVTVTDISFNEDTLVIDFSHEYNNLDRVAEVMLRSATVKTLCQISGVEYVEIYVEGQPLKLKADLEIGRMSDSEFIDNLGSNVNFTQTVDVPVFFAASSGEGLKESIYRIENTGYLSLAELAMYQLVNGPIEGQDDVLATIDDGTKLNSIVVRDGTAYVDLNKAFMKTVKGISAEQTVYSVVNSLTSIPSIKRVRFLIEGETVKSLGTVNMTSSFDFNTDIVLPAEGSDN